MLKNYVVSAWRQILKNKLYAAINILGLMVGLAIFVFGTLLVRYENSHDTNWKNSDRTFTAGTVFGPSANIGINETDGMYTAFAPFIDEEVPEVTKIARTVQAQFLLSHGDDNFYESMQFADPEFLDIFDFEYLEGDDRALDDPSGLLITEDMARKYFGDAPALGEVLTLDHDVALHVTAVIANPPRHTHLVSSIIDDREFGLVAPLKALNAATDYDLAGNFHNLSTGDFTYMLLADGKDRDWLQAAIDGIFERHYPDESREFITGLKVRPLVEANNILWDAIGLPVLSTVSLLAFLVLVVAIVNYTNLATAQSLGRAREIGLRKTLGASRRQLVLQFLVESTCVAVLAMLCALALLELVIPAFNTLAHRDLAMNYSETLPWLTLVTLSVGLVAGAYPAYLITRASPIEALRDGGGKGVKGARFRSAMLVLQFSISIFMLAMVMVTYYQNKKIQDASNIYPKSEIITLQRLDVDSIQERLDTLRNELLKLPGVESVTYSSLVPYLQSSSGSGATREKGNEDASFLLNQIAVDENFLETYDIPLLAGRGFDQAIAGDTIKEDVLAANVIVNELAAERLGFSSPAEAINQVYYDVPDDREPRAYTIVGVIANQNFQGFHNQIKPTVMKMVSNAAARDSEALRFASIRVSGVALADTLSQVEGVWDDLIDDYPIQSEFLEETFGDTYQVFAGMTFVLGGFAFVALCLSLIGLFGLAAFMASTRTREIGIRKVMGASMGQIVRLLIWQFSRPVIWALVIALPLSYLAANTYLNFFAERIPMPEGIVGFAGLLAVFVAWSIVAVHAVRVAAASPIRALRYE
jgi:putative ABC transport system permease protein